MTQYRFDRGSDYQFRRAPDYQRNAGGMEGQVIAQHKWIGHPPFSSNQIHSASDGLDEEGHGTVDPWISQIANWLENGDPKVAYRVDTDYLMEGTDKSRYLTWHLVAGGGAYDHSITCAKHTNGGAGGIAFDNGAPAVREHFHAYSGTDGDFSTYEFGLNDDGSTINSNTAPYSTGKDFWSPSDSASMKLLGGTTFNPNGWPSTVARSAYVTSNSACFHVVMVATDPENPANTTKFDCTFLLTLEDPWPFDGTGSIQDELDTMLAQVTLTNAAKQYAIEGDSTRKLLTGGESITVTHEGPTVGNPLRYVFKSNGPWNWAANGPCIVAEYLNDIVNAVGESGVDPATDEGDVNFGGDWQAIKSMVLLPLGPFLKTIKSYQQPVQDTSSWSDRANGRHGSPPSPNSDAGGELLATDHIALNGTGRLRAFSRGDWITITELESGPAGIAGDGTPIDTDARPIDQ